MLTKIPDLMRPAVVARRAAVHWQNARVALSMAIQHRAAAARATTDADGLAAAGLSFAAASTRDLAAAEQASAATAYQAARQCADLAAAYRRRLVVLVGPAEAAIANAFHRDGFGG